MSEPANAWFNGAWWPDNFWGSDWWSTELQANLSSSLVTISAGTLSPSVSASQVALVGFESQIAAGSLTYITSVMAAEYPVIDSLLASETSETYIVLLTITHEDGVIRLTSDSVDTNIGISSEWEMADGEPWITGDGTAWFTQEQIWDDANYEAFPFDITMPTVREGQISTAQLRIDNVSQRLIDEIRNQSTPMTVKIDVVLASDKSLMATYEDFTWRGLTYDVISISGVLTLEGFLNEPFSSQMTARTFSGLF